MSNKLLGQIKVEKIIDNADGTCTVHFDISEEVQKNIIEALGWDEWSEDKFNKFVNDSLDYYAKLKKNKI